MSHDKHPLAGGVTNIGRSQESVKPVFLSLSLLELFFDILGAEAGDVPAAVDRDGLINEFKRDLPFFINEPHSCAFFR